MVRIWGDDVPELEGLSRRKRNVGVDVTGHKSGYVVSVVEGLSCKDTEHRLVHAVSVV